MFITDGAPPEPHPQRMVKGTWWQSYILLFVGFIVASTAAYLAFYRPLDEPLDVRTRASSASQNGPLIALVGVEDGATLEPGTVPVTGVAYHTDGIASIVIVVDGIMAVECPDTDRCRYGIMTDTLAEGAHIITVTARSGGTQGQESSASVTVFR